MERSMPYNSFILTASLLPLYLYISAIISSLFYEFFFIRLYVCVYFVVQRHVHLANCKPRAFGEVVYLTQVLHTNYYTIRVMLFSSLHHFVLHIALHNTRAKKKHEN